MTGLKKSEAWSGDDLRGLLPPPIKHGREMSDTQDGPPESGDSGIFLADEQLKGKHMVRNNDNDLQQVLIPAPQQITQRTTPALERLIEDSLRGKPEAVAIGMGHVQAIDSYGLTWLINVQSRLQMQGVRTVIQDASVLVQDIFTATRLDGRFSMAYSAKVEARHAGT